VATGVDTVDYIALSIRDVETSGFDGRQYAAGAITATSIGSGSEQQHPSLLGNALFSGLAIVATRACG
jgi:hypothetical protein